MAVTICFQPLGELQVVPELLPIVLHPSCSSIVLISISVSRYGLTIHFDECEQE